MKISVFTFNPAAENTYIVQGFSNQCLIVDPGMMDESDDEELFRHIEKEGLEPVLLVNTHCHLDHVLGNQSVIKKYNIPFAMHRLDLPTLEMVPMASMRWGVPYRQSPDPSQFLEEGEHIQFDGLDFEIRFVPGHAPGHIVLVEHQHAVVFGGDVLFRESVGRTDLPGGDGVLLAKMIQEKMYSLPDDFVVYPGHGGETTMGWEKQHNPFVRPQFSAFS